MHMKSRILVALVLTLACSGVAWGLQPDGIIERASRPSAPAFKVGIAPVVTAEQRGLQRAAEAEGVRVDWDTVLTTPVRIRGLDLGKRTTFSRGKGLRAAGGGAYENNAVAILDNLSGFFRAKDAALEFKAHRVDADTLGDHHVRVRQMYQGLKVVGGELIVHFGKDDTAYEVNGRYVPDVSVGIAPTISAADAVAAAQKDLGERGLPSGELASGPELVVFAWESDPVLAYEMELTYEDVKAVRGRWRYWIDAANGKVIRAFNAVTHITAPTSNGSNTGISGNYLAGEGGGATNVTGWYENGNASYYLYNKTRYWYVYNVASSGYSDNNTYAYRSTSAWGTSDRAEMSAAKNYEITQAYYKNVHNRNSFNNANAYARVNVHQGVNYVNAYWDGTDFHFGDGDGVEANSLVVLDVAGHEYTHAVTEYTANLYYSSESGALNESFSDIFGSCVEFYGQPDGRSTYPNVTAGRSDWLCGEDCWLSSKALRDLRSPANPVTVGSGNEQPSRYKGTYWYFGTGDNGGVHYNSGVQNFFFYLLCEGGSGVNDGISYSVTGIAVTNAEKVAYRALTVYCGQYTDYAAVRAAWMSAAQDFNPSWTTAVSAAWAACGIGAATPTVATPTFSPAGGAYGSSVVVTMSCATVGATIRYTTNESEPTESSALYSAPITITSDTTLKAKAFKTGMNASLTASATYSFLGTRIYNYPMDTNPGWTTSGQWAFGVPTGGGGEHGSPDPTSGYTGNNVYGYNLSGDYANSIATTYWLTTGALNLQNAASTKLVFRRWLGVERPAYDHAYIEVSNNGSTWTRVWENTAEVADSSWQQLTYDISTVADGQAAVYIRWGLGITDGSWIYCGWNIDDVEIWGQVTGGGAPAAPSGLGASALSGTRVRLTWTDNSSNEQGFAIERKTSSTSYVEITRVGAGTATYEDTTVSQGSSYTYRVRAYNASGYSSYSGEANVTTPTGTGDSWDPGDDSGSTATALPAPSTSPQTHGPHTLSSTDYYDWFAIYLEGGFTYNFNSAGGSGDMYGELYSDSAGSTRVAFDDDSGGNLQFSLNYAPAASAWFYLRARTYGVGGTASYTLTYNRYGGGGAGAPRDDFNGDGKADMGVYWPVPGNGYFYVWPSDAAQGWMEYWAYQNEVSVVGDYDGDGLTDVATFNTKTAMWYVDRSSLGYREQQWGWAETIPVPGDYNGDGVTEMAVFYPAGGTWYIRDASGSMYLGGPVQWGFNGAVPVPADYDGDGKTDIAIFSPASGRWYILQSSTLTMMSGAPINWGWSTTHPVPADFNGDGKADLAVYYPAAGKWYVLQTSNWQMYMNGAISHGWSAAIPVPGDFDGDHRADPTVYHPQSGNWYILPSSGGGMITRNWGFNGAQPVSPQYYINRRLGFRP